METHKLTQDEWDSLLDDERIPVKQDWAEQHLHAQAMDAAARAPKPELENEPDWDPSTRGYSIAREALKVINGARQDRYGDPEDNFKIVADLWTDYLRALKHDMPLLTRDDIANMMVLFKMARIVGGEYHRDSDVDLVGYALLGADIRSGRNAD